MTTLFDITHRVASELAQTFGGEATGGSTTTLIDTTLLDQYPEDYFNEGTIWIVYDAGAAGAAPQGEYAIIKDFNSQTTTLTLQAALTAAPAAGDSYLLSTAAYPLWMLRDTINRALDEIGIVEVFDTSTTTAAAQTEYALPASNIEVKRVMIQGVTTDSNDNRWREINGWRVEKSASGSADKLVLATQPSSGYSLGIVYTKVHPQLYLSSSTVDERLHIPQLVKRAAMLCVQRRLFDGDSDPNLKNQLDMLTSSYNEMRAQTPMPRKRRVRLFSSLLSGRRETDTFTVDNQ